MKSLPRKIFYCVCLIISTNLTAQQKKGFIVDPDGYTNVREAGNVSSNIVTKIIDGEIFQYTEDQSSWYPVQTYTGQKGFVHKSRIKEFKINADLSLHENMQELLVFRKSSKIISVYGNSLRQENGLNLFSGLIIGDGLNKVIYHEMLEGGIQSFELKDGQIYIYEYANLPTSKDFNYSLVPYALSRTFFIGDRVINISKQAFYNFPKFTDETIVSSIEEIKSKQTSEPEYYKVIDLALLYALNNKEIGEEFLYKLESLLTVSFDGEYAEKYQDALLVYEINKHKR